VHVQKEALAHPGPSQRISGHPMFTDMLTFSPGPQQSLKTRANWPYDGIYIGDPFDGIFLIMSTSNLLKVNPKHQ
jgi:hypothetical protein